MYFGNPRFAEASDYLTDNENKADSHMNPIKLSPDPLIGLYTSYFYSDCHVGFLSFMYGLGRFAAGTGALNYLTDDVFGR